MSSRSVVVSAVSGGVAVMVAAAAFVAVTGATGSWLGLRNPFAETTIDRTGPSVLQSLNDISEFHPAYAHFETVVDLEGDASKLPSWFRGERVIYVGKGDVDAIIDFRALNADSVAISEDGASVTASLARASHGQA